MGAQKIEDVMREAGIGGGLDASEADRIALDYLRYFIAREGWHGNETFAQWAHARLSPLAAAATSAAVQRLATAMLRIAEVMDGVPVPSVDALAFMAAFNAASERAYNMALEKGWYETPSEDGTRIALMHSELSEALEGLRAGNPPSDKIPPFTQCEEELADVIIRILDFAGRNKMNIGAAIVRKMEFNASRPHKHGGKAF